MALSLSVARKSYGEQKRAKPPFRRRIRANRQSPERRDKDGKGRSFALALILAAPGGNLRADTIDIAQLHSPDALPNPADPSSAYPT